MTYYTGNRNKEKDKHSKFILRWAKKLKAIQHNGGVCEKCGESSIWLLQFHHPGEKENAIHRILMRSWKNIIDEVDKCVLVCERCTENYTLVLTPKRTANETS
jgi:hypothetical protein